MAQHLLKRTRWSLPLTDVWGIDGGHANGHPTALLLHGLGGDLDNMPSLFRGLGDHRRYLAYDHPGFGPKCRGQHENTMDRLADVAAQVIEVKNGGAPVDLVGISMGGLVSVALMARHPHLVRRAVLLAPAGPGNHAPVRSRALRWLTGDERNPIPQVSFLWTRFHWMVMERAAHLSFSEAFSYYLQKMSKVHLSHHSQTFLRTTANLLGEDRHLDWAAQVRQPVLILHGTEDGLVPVDSSQRYEEHMQNVTLQIFEGAGHNLFQPDPDRVLKPLLEHLDHD